MPDDQPPADPASPGGGGGGGGGGGVRGGADQSEPPAATGRPGEKDGEMDSSSRTGRCASTSTSASDGGGGAGRSRSGGELGGDSVGPGEDRARARAGPATRDPDEVARFGAAGVRAGALVTPPSALSGTGGRAGAPVPFAAALAFRGVDGAAPSSAALDRRVVLVAASSALVRALPAALAAAPLAAAPLGATALGATSLPALAAALAPAGETPAALPALAGAARLEVPVEPGRGRGPAPRALAGAPVRGSLGSTTVLSPPEAALRVAPRRRRFAAVPIVRTRGAPP